MNLLYSVSRLSLNLQYPLGNIKNILLLSNKQFQNFYQTKLQN